MSLKSVLFDFERFLSREWRAYSKEDPMAKLSFNEFDYLKVIQLSKEPIRITDLAKEMMVAKPSASNMIVRLEKKGLVQRTCCAEDARVKRVILTEKAKNDLSLEEKVNSIIAAKLEKRITAEEAEQIVAIFTKMMK
ncbi:MarR family transcriptional regulator [Vibrio sp. JC009]|uniref:MarR family winged helix-turn-helix transcriptional regulator n=1 Tax=Vibrio sp. JC009 TaxID=2912314 RepID=UPI0023B0CFBC|nr:MarR family transcriptional regulator [Vibrio sp. JC009]WED22439.1 MarR family transcriptional regulator [Vibrio sp. JC009]